MSAKKPTLIFVHGAWQSAAVWEKVTLLLAAKDLKCVTVTLPSTTGNPTTTFSEDIEAVRSAIVAETTVGNEVLLVLHSYGGAVGQSAVKDLAGVRGMVLITSSFAVTGMSLIDSWGGTLPPSFRSDPSGFVYVAVPARELFYHDLPLAEGDIWVSRLTQQAQEVMLSGEDSYAGWMDMPIWFLAATEDKSLPFEFQKMFIAGAKEAGADVTVREVDSGHSPMLSKPQETADFIFEAVVALEKKGSDVV